MHRPNKSEPLTLSSLRKFDQCTIDGLVSIKNDEIELPLAEQLAVHEARELSDDPNTNWEIDQILFRRFSDDRSSQVAAYIIDNKSGQYDTNTLADLQQKLWLNGKAPLVYVHQKTKVEILSCAREQEFWKDGQLCYHPSDQYRIAATISEREQEKKERYWYAHLVDGTFWNEEKNAKLANADKTSHKLLIDSVISADQRLDGEKNPALRRLLLIFVLIKYLEDREIFPKGWFGSNYHKGARCFLDVLSKAPLYKIKNLLRNLESRFNGDVFSLSDDDWSGLTVNRIRAFSDLINTRIIDEQLYLWDQYSFRYIPAEVLSHLYQHFSDRSKEAIFTPPFLASLLLDYTMPFEEISGKERICDPTCGSGIFLVGAFRRLIAKWRSEHNWRHPGVEELKKILRNSIYGVELQDDSLPMAAFNLALAVCDSLMPNVIWKDLRFDNLIGSNLFPGDFFGNIDQLKKATRQKGFDIILGNPPFASVMTPAGVKLEQALPKDFPEIPDSQIAFAIARHSMTLLSDGGRLCLIQPSGVLYNKNPEAFWRDFLQRNQVEAVLDFASIRQLYYAADPKTVAIVATRREPRKNHEIHHETYRRTKSVKERICFELDHYDCHLVPQQVALECRWVWRVNLLGGGRLNFTAQRLKQLPTLEEYVLKQKWSIAEGINDGKPLKHAPWLKEKKRIHPDALQDDGIDYSYQEIIQNEWFESPHDPERYTAPLVLVRKLDRLPSALLTKGFLAFSKQIVSISASEDDQSKLIDFYSKFLENKKVLSAFSGLMGTRAGSGMATSLNSCDIKALPWPSGKKDGWNLTWWEQLLCTELVDLVSEYQRLGQNSKLLKQVADDNAHEYFSSIYVRMLGGAYPNLKSAGWNTFGNLTCHRFCFGDEPTLEWGEDWTEPLEELVYHERHESLRTVRVIYHYHGNTILIVKPDRLRYWIGSTAIRDADETLSDLQEQGF